MNGALRRSAGHRGGGRLAAGIFILIALPLFLYPILNLVNVSLKTSGEFMKNPVGLTRSLHFRNYAQIFVKGTRRYFTNSVPTWRRQPAPSPLPPLPPCDIPQARSFLGFLLSPVPQASSSRIR
jgi:hypothetical protein